ncbi:hypothetical protein Taro_027329 [Colocasia esculenta]|uniref:Bifunctional inhibitor/plant lipid transfer protein/seed storage helical domain-containing protein n=1 Tax=Colocasia esculenta TaxID=4460 RepID=A0A843VU06_COLES|nr:hypothetical protein [Colocasia esculenta]
MAKQLLASTTLLVLLVAVLAAGHLPAATPAESSTIFCNMTQEGLNACKPAVTKSNPADPSLACCAALSSADLGCLCNFKNTNPKTMRLMGVDPDLAMKLPAKCNIPPPANC